MRRIGSKGFFFRAVTVWVILGLLIDPARAVSVPFNTSPPSCRSCSTYETQALAGRVLADRKAPPLLRWTRFLGRLFAALDIEYKSWMHKPFFSILRSEAQTIADAIDGRSIHNDLDEHFRLKAWVDTYSKANAVVHVKLERSDKELSADHVRVFSVGLLGIYESATTLESVRFAGQYTDLTGHGLGTQLQQVFSESLPMGTMISVYITNQMVLRKLGSELYIDATDKIRQRSNDQLVVNINSIIAQISTCRRLAKAGFGNFYVPGGIRTFKRILKRRKEPNSSIPEFPLVYTKIHRFRQAG